MRKETRFIAGHDGLKLFYRHWEPDEPRGSVVLVHGVNEHSGRYLHVAEFFARHGLAVHAIDQRGFGQSEGTRCYIDRFEDYVKDLRLVVEMASINGKPLMVGHSMGGLVAYRYGLTHPETLKALVLSSPWFGLKAKVNPLQKAVAPLLAFLAPRLQLPVAFSPEVVCRDPEVVKRYCEDPLICKNATPRWFIECSQAVMACHQGLTQGMKLPVLFLQAGDDHIVDPDATRAVWEQVPHPRKHFKLYPDMYHEIFNDPRQEEVFQDILTWLREQDLVNAL